MFIIKMILSGADFLWFFVNLWIPTELYDLTGHLKSFLKDKRASNGRGRMFATELLKNMETRFPSCGADNSLYASCRLLDPRYNGIQLEGLKKLEQTRAFLIDQANDQEQGWNTPNLRHNSVIN